MKLAQSCPTFCDPMDCSIRCSSIHGILQARILEWVAISFSRRSSQPRDRTRVSPTAGRCFTIWATREAQVKQITLPQCGCASSNQVKVKVKSCPTLCDPMDCSLPGFSVHGIFQSRVLEWVAISFSKGSFRPRDQTQVSRIVGRRFTVWTTREAPIINWTSE